MSKHRSYLETLSEYASLSCESLRQEISALLKQETVKLVVLDDDPTGIQTVQGCLLLTNWKPENLEKAFLDESPIFYLLTNTRSMTAERAAQTTAEAVKAVVEVNRRQGFRLVFISRSDSTLRGHFPLEPDTIRRILQDEQLPVLASSFFVPAFFEAGRYSIGGIQYLKDKDSLLPVSETEFAKDNVFGYKHAGLSDYIVEKSLGRVSAEEIGQLTLEELRRNSLQELTLSLKNQLDRKWITVDALGYDDLWKFALVFLKTLAETDAYAVLRTSSSLPKALSGMADQALLEGVQLLKKPGIGLFVVGSHVQKSSAQLDVLLQSKATQGIEVDVPRLLAEPEVLMGCVQTAIQAALRAKRTPVVFTSRKEIRSDDAAERLGTGKAVSDFLVRIVRECPFEPAYLVAKGGITSHDILTKGLGIETAVVAGQLLPGVPVIRTHRNRPFVIFPGNVGETDALKQVLEKFS